MAARGVEGTRLLRGQRETYKVRWPGGGSSSIPRRLDPVAAQVRLVVEALHEILAPPGSADPPLYGIVSAEWATRWPAEELWVASRR